jgi:hypothetical protein
MMNPLTWSREHQIALLLTAVIAAALGTVLGYIVYALGWGEGALPFQSWLWRLFQGPVWWALFGAVVGAAGVFVRNLMHAPISSAGYRPTAVRSSRPAQDPAPERPVQRFPERPQERSSRLPPPRW